METARPSPQLTSPTVLCPDPRGLAEFYLRLLGGRLAASEQAGPGEPLDAGWAQVACGALTLNFEWERHWTAPVWPAEPGHQAATQHLDIAVEDLTAATAWALSYGGQARVRPAAGGRVGVVRPGRPPFLPVNPGLGLVAETH